MKWLALLFLAIFLMGCTQYTIIDTTDGNFNDLNADGNVYISDYIVMQSPDSSTWNCGPDIGGKWICTPA